MAVWIILGLALVGLVLFLALRGKGEAPAAPEEPPAEPPEEETIPCPSCGAEAHVTGNRWECPWCGDFGEFL